MTFYLESSMNINRKVFEIYFYFVFGINLHINEITDGFIFQILKKYDAISGMLFQRAQLECNGRFQIAVFSKKVLC